MNKLARISCCNRRLYLGVALCFACLAPPVNVLAHPGLQDTGSSYTRQGALQPVLNLDCDTTLGYFVAVHAPSLYKQFTFRYENGRILAPVYDGGTPVCSSPSASTAWPVHGYYAPFYPTGDDIRSGGFHFLHFERDGYHLP